MQSSFLEIFLNRKIVIYTEGSSWYWGPTLSRTGKAGDQVQFLYRRDQDCVFNPFVKSAKCGLRIRSKSILLTGFNFLQKFDFVLQCGSWVRAGHQSPFVTEMHSMLSFCITYRCFWANPLLMLPKWSGAQRSQNKILFLHVIPLFTAFCFLSTFIASDVLLHSTSGPWFYRSLYLAYSPIWPTQ